MMPFESRFDAVFEMVSAATKEAIEDQQINCYWLKDVHAAGRITDDIVKGIEDTTFCIADLTGNNPNVMWETGYAMALDKPTILIGQSVDSIPFDLKVHRILPYQLDRLNDLSHILGESIRQTVARDETASLKSMPANLFWLGHDLARSIRLAMFESEDLVELRRNIIFSLHHLTQVRLQASDIRKLLLSALADVKDGTKLAEATRKELVIKIAKAKNALGEKIASLQPGFQGFATLSEEEGFLRESE